MAGISAAGPIAAAGRVVEPRWPAWMALLTAPFLPATIATRTQHVSLVQAYLVHLTVALFTLIIILFLVAAANVPGPISAGSLMEQAGDAWGELVEQFSRYPIAWLVTAIITLAVELGLVVLAFVVMSWGACDEPIRSSFRHSLRRVWLQTPHVALAILAVGLWAVTLDRAESRWARSVTALIGVRPPPPANAGSQAYEEWAAATEAYNEKRAALYQTRPWYLKWMPGLIVIGGIVGGAWLLWGLLRSVGARRIVAPIARPPMCDECGYNLTATPPNSRCPECGLPVIESLGPDVRRGAVWQRRREVGPWAAWRQCAAAAVLAPEAFGRRLRLLHAGTRHRFFLVMHLPVVFVIGGLGMVGCYMADMKGQAFQNPQDFQVFAAAPMLGFLSALVALLLPLGVASLVALRHGVQDRRNLMPGSVQVAAYSIGYVVLWVALSWSNVAVCFLLEDVLVDLSRIVNIHPDVLTAFAWLLPNFLLLIIYLHIVAVGTRATRYANR